MVLIHLYDEVPSWRRRVISDRFAYNWHQVSLWCRQLGKVDINCRDYLTSAMEGYF